jgi:hypothetical protein
VRVERGVLSRRLQPAGTELILSVASSTTIRATIKSPCWVLVGLLRVTDVEAVLPPVLEFMKEIVIRLTHPYHKTGEGAVAPYTTSNISYTAYPSVSFFLFHISNHS